MTRVVMITCNRKYTRNCSFYRAIIKYVRYSQDYLLSRSLAKGLFIKQIKSNR